MDLAEGQTAGEVLSLLEPRGLRVATLTMFLNLAAAREGFVLLGLSAGNPISVSLLIAQSAR